MGATLIHPSHGAWPPVVAWMGFCAVPCCGLSVRLCGACAVPVQAARYTTVQRTRSLLMDTIGGDGHAWEGTSCLVMPKVGRGMQQVFVLFRRYLVVV